MKMLKSAGLAGALLVAAGTGASLTPVAHGQTASTQVAPRAVELLGGRGAQIGVAIRDVESAEVKGKEGAQGVYVQDVTADSPAASAGFRKGDVILEFDGERVRSARQFSRLVQETVPGRGVQAVLLRDGQRTTVSVTPRANDAFTLLGDRVRVLQDFGRNFGLEPPVRPAVPAPRATPRAPDVPRMPDIESFIWRGASVLGLTVSDLSAQLADYFGVKDGVLVTSVSEGSGAAKAGVKAGDVVTSVNGSTVSSPSDLRRRVQRLSDGEEFTLGVVRDKKTLTLKGKVEDGRGRRTIRTIV